MVSVIIPVFNRENTIKRAMESVLSQTYTDIELIVVDDCSTDGTRKAVEAVLDPRVHYYVLEKNSGACAARNKGISVAKGDYIAFQDSDDSWRENKLETQLKTILEAEADVCFCRFERHNYGSGNNGLFPNIPAGMVPFETLLCESVVSTQTILGKKEVFENILFDEAVRRRQDYDWTIRAGQHYSFVLCDDALVDVYLQDDSISNLSAKKSLDTFLYLLTKYKDLKNKYPQFEYALMQKIAYYSVMAGSDATRYYIRLFELKHTIKNAIYIVFAKLHVLGFIYKK